MTDEEEHPGEAAIRALVAEAEEIPDPLADLLERSKTDAGAAFVPEVLDALALLHRDEPAEFERLRADLKRLGIRVAELDFWIAQREVQNADGHGGSDLSIRDLEAALSEMALFRSPKGDAHADVEVNGHRETHAVSSQAFEDYLHRRHFEMFREPAAPEEIRKVVDQARALARFGPEERTVHVRVAQAGGHLYLDLGDPQWRAVEITPEDWSIIDAPPVRFIRPAGLRALPEPMKGGSIAQLRRYVNADDDGFVLIVGWLLAALCATGPYPVLALSGAQGSSKSTLTKFLKLLVDPHELPHQAAPETERDLVIVANSAHVIAFDNASGLSARMSDACCRLASGSGLAARRLYTDDDVHFVSVCRPIVINGIDNVVTRPDLASRALFVELREIARGSHRPMREIEVQFNDDLPDILGALLTAMSHGLRNRGAVDTEMLPRMADAAAWIIACEGALWEPGTFLKAVARSDQASKEHLIDRNPVVPAILKLMQKSEQWSGTATLLLARLGHIDPHHRGSRDWPQTPSQLGAWLHGRLQPLLRDLGIEVAHDRQGHTRERIIILRRTTNLDGPPIDIDAGDEVGDHSAE